MGFQQNASNNNVRNLNMPTDVLRSGGGNRHNWQSDAFINIYLPRKDGSKAKLGSIGLKMSKATDAKLLEYIANAEDADSAMDAIKDRLVLDFQTVGGEQSADLDL